MSVEKKFYELGRDFSVPQNAVTQTFGILGRRGSGKTNLAVVMAEEMLADNQMIVWIDPVGAAWGLRTKFKIMIAGGERGDIPLEPTSGKLMAEFLVENRVSCILDLSAFGEGEIRRFVADFGARFYQLSKAKRQAVHLFFDEADEYAPQDARGPDAAKSISAMQNLVRRGQIGRASCRERV